MPDADELYSLRAAYEARGEQLVRERAALADAVHTRIAQLRSEVEALAVELAHLKIAASGPDDYQRASDKGMGELSSRLSELVLRVNALEAHAAKPPAPRVLVSLMRVFRPVLRPLLSVGAVKRVYETIRGHWA